MDEKNDTAAGTLTAHNIRDVLELEREVKRKRNVTDCCVDAVTNFCGSMRFVYLHVLWFAVWISADLVLHHRVFDPFPYQLLTLVVSLEAILLSALVLISQNRDARIADRRNHLALQIELLAEQENTKMLKILDAIAKKLDVDISEDPTTKALEEATDPKRLADQIDSALSSDAK